MSKTNTSKLLEQHCAGIDVSKGWLDVAICRNSPVPQFKNTAEGHAELVRHFRQHGIRRIGIEASGSYEREVVGALREARFQVHVFQPVQVKAFAAFKLKRAKTDRSDARLIASCVFHLNDVKPPPDPRLQEFSDILTRIDQLGEDLIRAKTRTEHARDKEIRSDLAAEVKRLRAEIRRYYARLARETEAHADLNERLALIESIDGIGRRTALVMLVRMPELGAISREQAAQLIGLAPITRQSGTSAQASHIEGGRRRARTALFACAQAAIKWNAQLKALYARLIKRGKHHRAAIVACARKLTIFINTVLTRKAKWQSQPAKA